MTAVIAVHCGAGGHKEKNFVKYNKLCKVACLKAVELLNNGGSALEAVKAAIVVLENNPLTNAGVGSNLTVDGTVEMDASIMDGKTLLSGGCGAVVQVKNPIELAYNICKKQLVEHPNGLIPPSLLVGKGAHKYAKKVGLKTTNKKYFLTSKTMQQYKKYSQLINGETCTNNSHLDTVGAVCLDKDGNVAAGCSSGGLILKQPGRVGQAALYGSGVYADSFNSSKNNSVAVCTSGCGEHLIRTQLAREIALDLKQNKNLPTITVTNTMREKFLKSEYLKNINEKMGGALIIYKATNGDGEILWAHSTATMSIGYMKTTDKRPKAMVSQLSNNATEGGTINVGGHSFDHFTQMNINT